MLRSIDVISTRRLASRAFLPLPHHEFLLAQTHHVDSVDRNVMRTDEVRNHELRAPAEAVVVVLRPGLIRVLKQSVRCEPISREDTRIKPGRRTTTTASAGSAQIP